MPQKPCGMVRCAMLPIWQHSPPSPAVISGVTLELSKNATRCPSMQSPPTYFLMTTSESTKEYVISISTSDLRKAIAQLGSNLYDLLEQSLMTADEEDESDFGRFARETLNVLASHPEQLSHDADAESGDPEPAEDIEPFVD